MVFARSQSRYKLILKNATEITIKDSDLLSDYIIKTYYPKDKDELLKKLQEE